MAEQSEITALSPADEAKFRGWAAANKITDVDSPESRYDYRGYWKDVAAKGGDQRKTYADGPHFPDTYKQHGHPTFSVESKYSKGPGDGGTWNGETFVPATVVMADQATDPVADILRKQPMTDAVRAQVWDAYHSAVNEDALAESLKKIGMPTPAKAALWDLKHSEAPATEPDFKQTDTSPNEIEPERTWGDTAKDVAVGVAKGLGSTAFGLGKIVHDYTPVGRISDAIQPGAFDQRPPELTPTNTPQKIGFTGEQVGEFFVPASPGKFVNAPKWVLKSANALKDAGVALAQTGSPVAAGVTGAVTAALPGGGAVKTLAGKLEGSAEKSVAQALGAAKEWAKDEAGRLAPQMLERRVGGSRAAMLERAQGMVKELNQQIGAEVQAAAQAGKTVDGVRFVDAIANTRQTLTMVDAAGKARAIPGQETAVRQLDRLAEFVEGLGGDIPIEKAQMLKTAWDRIVSKAGLFGPKATSSASDNAKAWAYREAAGSMRKLIAEGNPTLNSLNQEYRFWKGLESVLTATEKRTQAQSGGLTQALVGTSGAAAGFASGDGIGDRFEKALLGGVIGKQVIAVAQSPAFRTQVSGPLKQALADALVSGSEGRVMTALAKITSALPARATASQ